MEMRFENGLEPAEVLCDFLNLKIPEPIDLELMLKKGFLETDYYKQKKAIINGFTGKYPSVFFEKDEYNIPGSRGLTDDLIDLERGDFSFNRLLNFLAIKRRTECMLSEIRSSNDSFSNEAEFRNFFNFSVHYDQSKKCLMLSKQSSFQEIIGLAILNLKDSKYRIEVCPLCNEFYAAYGNYRSAGCEKHRAKIALSKYNEKVKSNQILNTYTVLNNRYSKRYINVADPVKHAKREKDYREWQKKAKQTRDEYYAKYKDNIPPDIFEEYLEKLTWNLK